jgi:hypothetical protein
MRPALRAWGVASALLLASIAGAGAEERAECEAGIAFIRTELERAADGAKREALAKALREAEQELGESEFDECLEAVEDAREVVGATPR